MKLPEPGFDISKFVDPDLPPGEPKFNQVVDPFTGDVICPGMRIDNDGNVIRSGDVDVQ